MKVWLALTGLVAVAEGPQWWAARRGLGRPAGEPEVILVLGNPLRGMQRWRTEIAVRSRGSARTRLVFSGAGEAAPMAAYAAELGVPGDRIVLETRARSTWENVAFSLPWLEGAGTIKVASSPLHAARGREYLWRQRPDLAGRLAAADDRRAGERLGWKLATVAYVHLRRWDRRGRPGRWSVGSGRAD